MADAIENHHPGLKFELIICKPTGENIQIKPLHEAGGKGLFTKELEEALLANTVDFAVHSFKDVPVTMPLVDQANLVIAAVPPREDPSDVLACAKAKSIRDLPQSAKVGTGSLRRRCQLLALRPDLKVELIRGNIDTRVRKFREGQYDAVILALAGLKRSGMFNDTDMAPIPLDEFLPAAAQGALAIQCRKHDERAVRLLSVLNDPIAHQCVALERSLVQELNGDCHSPIAALATIAAGSMHLWASVGARDGKPLVIDASGRADRSDPEPAVAAVYQSLLQQGAAALLAGDA